MLGGGGGGGGAEVTLTRNIKGRRRTRRKAAARGDMEIREMEENGAKQCLGGKCDESTTGPSPRSGVTPYRTLAGKSHRLSARTFGGGNRSAPIVGSV